jgi:hypothetical protein
MSLDHPQFHTYYTSFTLQNIIFHHSHLDSLLHIHSPNPSSFINLPPSQLLIVAPTCQSLSFSPNRTPSLFLPPPRSHRPPPILPRAEKHRRPRYFRLPPPPAGGAPNLPPRSFRWRISPCCVAAASPPARGRDRDSCRGSMAVEDCSSSSGRRWRRGGCGLRDNDSTGLASSGGVARRRQVAGALSPLLPRSGRMQRHLLPCSPVDTASPSTSSAPPAHLVRLLAHR